MKKLNLEYLEDRITPAIILWSPIGVSTDWSVPGNWSGGAVPTNQDDVRFQKVNGASPNDCELPAQVVSSPKSITLMEQLVGFDLTINGNIYTHTVLWNYNNPIMGKGDLSVTELFNWSHGRLGGGLLDLYLYDDAVMNIYDNASLIDLSVWAIGNDALGNGSNAYVVFNPDGVAALNGNVSFGIGTICHVYSRGVIIFDTDNTSANAGGISAGTAVNTITCWGQIKVTGWPAGANPPTSLTIGTHIVLRGEGTLNFGSEDRTMVWFKDLVDGKPSLQMEEDSRFFISVGSVITFSDRLDLSGTSRLHVIDCPKANTNYTTTSFYGDMRLDENSGLYLSPQGLTEFYHLYIFGHVDLYGSPTLRFDIDTNVVGECDKLLVEGNFSVYTSTANLEIDWETPQFPMSPWWNIIEPGAFNMIGNFLFSNWTHGHGWQSGKYRLWW